MNKISFKNKNKNKTQTFPKFTKRSLNINKTNNQHLNTKRVKMNGKRCKHYMRQGKNAKDKTLNDPKNKNNPGSSHPYTQRQLVLERKLKPTCPQVK